ncbi:MAG: adenosine deaminase [Gemmatimonadaceae bacterium]|nr:adenosine deaminase [Gemmatimonadaceae bacterium]
MLITSELLRRLPKAELHCHLDGSVRPSTLIELGKEYKKPMPAASADELRDYMLVNDARNLEDYLTRFEVTISVMQTAESLERVAYELAEDAAKDGVRYIEVRNAPVLNVREGLSLGEAVEAPIRGLERAERDFGIKGRYIICALRNLAPDVSLELAQLAVSYKKRGVVAFDLAGGEAGNPASAHAEAFKYARDNNLALTVHAGEGDGSESVRQAVHVCGAQRIGHATRLIEDTELTQYVNDRRIALEICLTSNVQTRVASSYETHPLRQYFDHGMNVVLNTDNRLMSGTTLTEEYGHAARHLDFDFDELCTIALNSFESAFLPWEERIQLLQSVSEEMEAMSMEGK